MTSLADVAPAFGYVAHHGLLARTRDRGPQPEGSQALVMVGSPFSLRFERDGGQVFVHCSNNSHGWHRLEHVLAFLGVELPEPPEGEPASPESLAGPLRAHWNDVAQLFRGRHRVAALAD